LWWAWSGEFPFGELPGAEGDDGLIFGFAVCRYDETGALYRFTCNKHWQVVQDANQRDEEGAKAAIPGQYDASRVVWQRYIAEPDTAPVGRTVPPGSLSSGVGQGQDCGAPVEAQREGLFREPLSYTRQETIDDVVVIGFVERGATDKPPAMTFDRDYAELRGRMEAVRDSMVFPFAVVDFANYRITDHDNGRAVVGLVLRAHQLLAAYGGGLCVCNHPGQFNPDLQGVFRMDHLIGMCGSLREALDAVRARRMDGLGGQR
jgi:hypothetical protein